MLISTVTVAFHRRPDGTYAADIDAPFYRRSSVEAATFDDLIDLIQVTPEWVAFNPDGEQVDVEPAAASGPSVTYLMQTNYEDGRDYDWFDDEAEALEMAEIHSEGTIWQVDVFRQENWEGGKRTLIASFDDGRRIK